MHRITFGKSSIPYEVVRSSKRKTISITVDNEGVKVICPIDTTQEKMEAILTNKVIWIRKQLLHF